MPVILVATDFTPAGDHAARYGAALARDWGYGLQLLHAYYMPVSFNDPAIPIIPVDDLQDTNRNRMESAAAAIRAAYPDVPLTTRIEYGDIEDIVEELIEEVQPELLVIGSHSDEEESFWTGNTAAALLRDSKTAILAVPDTCTYTPVRKVCMAVDATGMPEAGTAGSLQAFLRQTGASLDVLHIAREGSTELQDPASIPLPDFGGDIPVRFHLIGGAVQVEEEIAAYTEAQHMDWLVVVPHHHSFWASLFHKSHTKAMVHKSAIPVLALH